MTMYTHELTSDNVFLPLNSIFDRRGCSYHVVEWFTFNTRSFSLNDKGQKLFGPLLVHPFPSPQ